MTLRFSCALALLSQGLSVLGQTTQAQFNQVINLNGDMNLNSVQFPDGSRIETFSQTQRQLLVNQNTAPLPGNQVTGTTGNPFVQLTPNSLVIQTNGATDLVGGQIELPINTQTLQQMGVTPDNTFVAKLSADRQSWMVMDTIKTVNNTDSTVRIVKLNNIDGEYIALGRQTAVTGVALTQFGTGPTNQVNITGSGIQENEFTDGFRMSIRASQPMIATLNVKNGISTTMLTALGTGTQSVNNFRYLVTTNLGGVVTNLNRMAAVVQLPINAVRLQTVATAMGATAQSNVRLSVAQRGILANPGGATALQPASPLQRKRQEPSSVQPGTSAETNGASQNNTSNGQLTTGSSTTGQTNGNTGNAGTGTLNPAAATLLLSPTFTPIQNNAVLDTMNARLAIPVTQIDGEYILTVNMASGQAAPAAPQAGSSTQLTVPQAGTSTQLTVPQASTALSSASSESSSSSTTSAGETSTSLTAAAAASTSLKPTGESSTSSESKTSTSAAAAAETSATSQKAATTGSGFVFRRQLPPLPQSQADGSVIVSMEWINYMADIQQKGGAVDVGAMMQQVSPGIASATSPAPASASSGTSVSGLIAGLKARRFQA
ncbi:uncharacterized protein PV09_08764 [Verruconis gallopava]|uniref:Uncharacterized protein n=1 Tax=Verruconis gallopava TaxID=253628 RepID=A0A0D1ZYU0_9PEZI|nr:uncharacterized protein PV09_08764 [Verruconis gallopava]KIV99587.1 hypothetical protein PV09_08764 [Verruconis gallopava]